ncbi:MAG: FkbM family methyltransferase [Deltaproteobacteria bacterium]|nr:FkbM family methyltransferase [Deltaproteobacteria bacterium]
MAIVTEKRIRYFCRYVLNQVESDIGFVDVGSGGDLKHPWKHLPSDRLKICDFEPTRSDEGKLPLCISNETGTAPFFVASDERASSFHKPVSDFVHRFGFDSMLIVKEVKVACTSLDQHLAGHYEAVDALDINVEGHDYQVLQGASALLEVGNLKLIKVEFELVPVWVGQGYFSDIDAFLRTRDFRLVHLQIDNARPSKVSHLHYDGEPIWGKALYVPDLIRYRAHLSKLKEIGISPAREELMKAVAIYIAAESPGLAYDAIDQAEMLEIIVAGEGEDFRERINHVFRWAKAESRFDNLMFLVKALCRRFLP